MSGFIVLTKFHKQWKTIWGFWEGWGWHALWRNKTWRQFGGWLEASCSLPLNLFSCSPIYRRRGPYANDATWMEHYRGFLLHNWRWCSRQWFLFTCTGWLTFEIFTYKNLFFECFYIWNLNVKNLICLSPCESQKCLPPTLTPSPDPICQKGRPRFILFYLERIKSGRYQSLRTTQSYLFSILYKHSPLLNPFFKKMNPNTDFKETRMNK